MRARSVARRERDPPAVGCPCRIEAEREACIQQPRAAPVSACDVDLAAPAVEPDECESLSVRRPDRILLVKSATRELVRHTLAQLQNVDRPNAAVLADEGDLSAVGRPRWLLFRTGRPRQCAHV